MAEEYGMAAFESEVGLTLRSALELQNVVIGIRKARCCSVRGEDDVEEAART